MQAEQAIPARAPLSPPPHLVSLTSAGGRGPGPFGYEVCGAPPRGALTSRPGPAPPGPGSGSAQGSGGRGGAERPEDCRAVGRSGGRVDRGPIPGPAARGG